MRKLVVNILWGALATAELWWKGAAAPVNAARRPSARAAAFAPWLEQSILFGMVSAAAAFWMAVIWWIVR